MIKFWSWLLLILLAAFPPSSLPGLSLCGFKFLTGLPCPLCGMTHGLVYWMHGQWMEALHWHLLTPIPFLFLFLIPFKARLPVCSTRLAPGLAGTFLCYGTLRWCGMI